MSARADTGEGRRTVLVTGGTGRVGRTMIRTLVQRGYLVRALTSRMGNPQIENVTWRIHDLRQADLDFRADVRGCSAIVHLAAALPHAPDKYRTNVEATGALAEAAESEGVHFFCYTSSVSVYGSSIRELVDENSPVLTTGSDVASEYWDDEGLRAYGRTKLQGEVALKSVVREVEYVVYRPTAIVDVDEVMASVAWPAKRRALLAHRHLHHIYVGDVAEAIVWAMQRSFEKRHLKGVVSTYNLSDDDIDKPTISGLTDFVLAAGGEGTIRQVRALPRVVDWGREALRARSLPLRRPFGYMHFSTAKLRAEGYDHPFGMESIRAKAASRFLQELGKH